MQNHDNELFQALETTIDNIIGIAFNYSDLIGKGTEYIVRNGVIVAKFYNGNFVESFQVNQDITIAS